MRGGVQTGDFNTYFIPQLRQKVKKERTLKMSDFAVDCLIADFRNESVKGEEGDKIKKLVDRVETLKFLRKSKIYENKDVLQELVRLTDELQKAGQELDDYLRIYRK